jgi:hypothetical protein
MSMSARWVLGFAFVITATLATFHVPASAQFATPNPVTCPKGPIEDDGQWTRRCRQEEEREYKENADRQSRAMMQQIAATERQRAILEKQPPLPASGNRLLGRWQTATRPAGGGDVFAQLAALASGCGVLIGDGIIEFQQARMAIHDNDGRNDLGAVEYRGGANGSVFVLPAKGSIFQLLPFEFETPDRIHLIGVACTLVRAKAAVPAAPTPPRSR